MTKEVKGNYETEVDGIGGTFAVVKARATPSLNWPLVIGFISLTIAIIGIAAALHMRKDGMVEKPSFLV